MIDITEVNLVEFAKAVYLLSAPKDMGFLHAKDGPLPHADAVALVDAYKDDKEMALRMDYTHGRACKMNVFRNGERLKIEDSWYDHTNDELRSLLSQFDISHTNKANHGCACECEDCLRARTSRN